MEYQGDFKEKANVGRLIPTTVRKSDKSPDMWGVICIDREYAKHLLAKENSEDFITVKLGAWKAPSKAGNNYLKLTVDTYVKPDGATAPVVKSQQKDPWE